MSTTTKTYGVDAADQPLRPSYIERRDLRPDDVAIEILYCGVCHSDLHQARNEWGNSRYPMVPGHEIIGRVTAVGSAVSMWRMGDSVGVGCMVDSCHACSSCQEGLEQYCEEGATFTYNSVDRHDRSPTYGGYSERIVVDQKFVLRIPAGLPLQAAAPLLCAGITTYSPLRHWRIGPGMQVGVVGLGGLGHMALKFAAALGAEVTLFTRSEDKKSEAIRLGAHEVILSTDAEQMSLAGHRFDFILDTVPHPHDLNPYLSTLKRDGQLVLVGVLEPIAPPVQARLLIGGRRSISGSVIGGIAETQEMLDFCAKHSITADIELLDIKDINQAYERMLDSDVRYRFVIDMATL
ncbi:MAG: NAD(P)-dependent alcohol dehydrogenase [Pseudomonadales bacterium]|nr:NAD(P)-dependent alcohol dehydrogenase [Pseudomonadales bacterium]